MNVLSRETRVEIISGAEKGKRGGIVNTGFACDRSRRRNGCSVLYEIILDGDGGGTYATADQVREIAVGEVRQSALW